MLFFVGTTIVVKQLIVLGNARRVYCVHLKLAGPITIHIVTMPLNFTMEVKFVNIPSGP